MTKILLFLGLFWLIQALVQIAFKLSSVHEHRFLLWFCAGHAIGVPSLWFLVQLYKQMDEPVAFGLAMGGAFLAAQVALFIAFKPSVSLLQWVGVLAICGGMVLLAAGGSPAKAQAAEQRLGGPCDLKPPPRHCTAASSTIEPAQPGSEP